MVGLSKMSGEDFEKWLCNPFLHYFTSVELDSELVNECAEAMRMLKEFVKRIAR